MTKGGFPIFKQALEHLLQVETETDKFSHEWLTGDDVKMWMMGQGL